MYILSSSGLLLDRISAGTTVVGAWSVARQLKASATFAYTAFDKGSGGTAAKIMFTPSGIADTAALLTLAGAQAPGNQATGLGVLNDQTGNANYLGRPIFSHYCPMTTSAGVLNAPTTVSGGFVVPTFSTGYNGLQAAVSGPYLTSGSWNGITITDLTPGVMAVPFGATNKFWSYAVIRLFGGVPSTTTVPGSGAGFTLNITTSGGVITSSTPYGTGVGYTAGLNGTVDGGDGNAVFHIDTVISGAVNAYHFTNSGTGYSTTYPASGVGRASSYTNTGDSTDDATTTSAALIMREVITAGFVEARADGANLSSGNAGQGTLVLVGSIFDGTHNTIRINGKAQTPINYGSTLGTGGQYAIGERAGVGPFGASPLAADHVEHLCGTTLTKSDMLLIERNLKAFYGIK